jgi:electron-transferring-flavoprotein dehydrogenase
MERADVVIVGGGPAGSSAAMAAAEADADAVAIEKGIPRADRDGLGADSTDAAGMLDYWVDIMDFAPEEIPEEVVLRDLSDAEFVGPNERVTLPGTGIEASWPSMGFTFDRVGMDDWLRERAERAEADYRVGTGVRDVETDLVGTPTHTVVLADGSEIRADHLILADGPQRTVTGKVLDRFMPDGESITDYLASTTANHIAYQEHRRFPAELFEEDALKFWWGVMPGETAYPWVFPNDGTVARVGLTMPIALDVDDLVDPSEWVLLREDDDSIPRGEEYLRRLLEHEYGDEYDVPDDFPLVEDRGKRGGTETYSISSTRPIDSPVGANVAVVGGAMGTTSAFHEGGYHVAVRTGKEAGALAAVDSLDRYNEVWKAAIGAEITRNVCFADIVEDYRPADWDRAFRLANEMLNTDPSARGLLSLKPAAGLAGLKLWVAYKRRKLAMRNGGYVQIRESKYTC